MQFSVKIATTIATLAAMAIAAPAAENIPLEERGTVVVNMYGGDTCNGAVDSFTVTNGAVRCVKVPSAKRSISVSGRYIAPLPPVFVFPCVQDTTENVADNDMPLTT